MFEVHRQLQFLRVPDGVLEGGQTAVVVHCLKLSDHEARLAHVHHSDVGRHTWGLA